MHRFYINLPLNENDVLLAPEEVKRHILVLRLRVGQTIMLFNGDTHAYLATIRQLDKKSALLAINQRLEQQKASPLTIDLLLCVIANDKMDLAIQKSVELGVTTITPILSDYSQKLTEEKMLSRINHWQKIIIRSSEQCGQNILPQIKAPVRLKDEMQKAYNGTRFILSPKNGERLLHKQKVSQVQLLVGPEGGFSELEIQQSFIHKFTPLKLGNLVLRSETATITGITFLQLNYGEW